MTTPALSVLDLVPVRSRQTSAQAVASSMALAQHADALGLTRYWFAEHHNMPSVASTAPPVLIAAAAARTQRIRVGSGGVMLPNHAPLIVAEQFAALEALAPGRIDLGIGRAPGSDPVITHLLRQSGTTGDVERFPSHVQDIAAMVQPDGATVRFTSGGEYGVKATPVASGSPAIWLLGSSDYSAQLAAAHGLPYVFANHFAGTGLERALDLYRSQFRPSETLESPLTFLTANVVAAPSAEEAEARALPQLRAMARLRSSKPMQVLETVEEAQRGMAEHPDAQEQALIDAMRQRWLIGSGADVRSALAAFAAQHGVDEIMVSPVAGSFDGEPLDATPGRTQTLDLLAA
ncbi:LLM class flavin-dependent oxidoreductase [Microbacterium esteraromaticum]|uniref:LLM class flavin-dependent oxidoreductase n=1 Tax=Microbacterium esteraromaticum TaxID=57043 RepID=A0A7D8AKF9_9MICO|nr:LLM class flavin-dependent oxidoreductase [Microbacterium esteraromaticum]QMU96328.1 LLM class flavin-dependent oxidoreductase [Microbacterium esteraromaticum]